MTETRESRFQAVRARLNERMLEGGGLVTKRFVSLDAQAYRAGALEVRTKELLGLVASVVLRCDDCIEYHLYRCRDEGITDQELAEALEIAMVVGGTITIPHLRRAYEVWLEATSTQP